MTEPAPVEAGGRLKVLVLARSYPNGVFPNLGLWTERPTAILARRCDVQVISPIPYCPPLPERGPFREFARFRRIPVREQVNGLEVLHPRYVAGPGASLLTLEPRAWWASLRRRVDRLREAFPFDLIHAHFIYPEGAVAARLARRYEVPFVVSEHAPWDPWLRDPRVARQALPAARRASRLMPVSNAVRETMIRFLGDGSNIRVVPVGVDGRAFPLGDGRRNQRLLFVGFANTNKGLDILFEALAQLRNRGERIDLLVVGGSHYRNTRIQEERLRRLPGELGIEDQVEFAGILPAAAVAEAMRESAAVVLPSRAESFGAVLVEALASGTPVIATRCGGPEDIVSDAVGMLVPPEDPAALADAISSLLRRASSYRPAILRRYALERYEWDRIVSCIHGAYVDAVSESRVRRR